jgi:hypothetical protein
MLSDAATIALARSLWPGLTTTVAADALLEAWLPWARAQQSIVSWGTQYDIGIACLLAHAGLRSPAAGSVNPGPTTSRSTLGLSQSWAAVQVTPGNLLDADLATTAAGLRWLSMRAGLVDFIQFPPAA